MSYLLVSFLCRAPKRVKTRLVFQVIFLHRMCFLFGKKCVFFHIRKCQRNGHTCCCQVAPNSWEWAWPAAPSLSSSRALGVNVQLCPKNGLNCGWCLAIRKVFFCQNFKKNIVDMAVSKNRPTLRIIGPTKLAILRTLPLVYRFKPSHWRVQDPSGTPKWMVYNGKPSLVNGWFGDTAIFGNIHIQDAGMLGKMGMRKIFCKDNWRYIRERKYTHIYI